MLRWIAALFSTGEPVALDAPASVPRVSHDEKSIVLEASDETQSLAWTDVSRVTIHTTDAGPFVTDLFWHIEDDDAHEIVVPMGCAGETELLRCMQQRLDDFDNMAVVEAMGSARCQSFLVWERERATPVPHASLRTAS